MKDTRPRRTLAKRLLRFAFFTLISLLLLVALVAWALTLPAVQQRLTHEAEAFLQKKLKTHVEVGAVRVRFPYYVSLEKFLLEEPSGDTLAQVGSLVVDLAMWKLLDKTVEFQKVTLEDARVRLVRRDSAYNFEFITRAFAKDTLDTPKQPADTTASPWKISLDLAVFSLKNVDFSLHDEDSKSETMAQVGTGRVVIHSADLKTLNFRLDELSLADANIRLVSTKPPDPDSEPAKPFGLSLAKADLQRTRLYYSTTKQLVDARLGTASLDGFRFASAGDESGIFLEKGKLENSTLRYRDPEQNPRKGGKSMVDGGRLENQEADYTPGHFNAGDIDVTSLNADFSGFSLQHDTISLQANALSGVDKSGLQLYELRGKLQVTPATIAVHEAHLRANRTSLDGDILLSKNEKETFENLAVQLQGAEGVIGDLITFLPPLETDVLKRLADFPYKVSGQVSGSLQNMNFANLYVKAGQGTAAHFDGTVRNLGSPDKSAPIGFNLRLHSVESVRADLLRFMSIGGKPMDSLLLTPVPAYAKASGSLSGNLAALQLSLQGQAGPLQTGLPIFQPSSAPPLQFDLAGSLQHADDPDHLGMDLAIHRLEAPRDFLAYLQAKGITTPDLLSATGTLKGSLQNLDADLNITAERAGATSRLHLDGLLQNLRTPDQLGFDLVLDGNLTRPEIYGYVPAKSLEKINLPSSIDIAGKAKGTMKDLNADLRLGLGGLGVLFVNGNLRDSTYKAEIVAQNLQLGRLMADTSLRAVKQIGLLVNVEGTGFAVLNTARLKAAGQFDSLIYNNLILRDVVFNGDVDRKKFTARLHSPDRRAAVTLNLSGDLAPDSTRVAVTLKDAKGKEQTTRPRSPYLQADLVLDCLDLREFGWTYRPTVICLRLHSRSEGVSLDSLRAVATIEKMDLQYDTVHVRPGDLALQLSLEQDHNYLNINSDWLQAELEGNFSLADLPKTLNNVMEQYFIVDRSHYVAPIGHDSLDFEIRILRPGIFTTGLVPGLSDLGQVRLLGDLNAQDNTFNLTANVTRMTYRNWTLDSINARAYAGDSAAMFVLTVPQIKQQGEVFVERLGINGRFVANRANMVLSAKNKEGVDRFKLAAQGQLLPNRGGAVISLERELILDFQQWVVAPGNEIRMGNGAVEIRDFAMTGTDGQALRISGKTSTLGGGRTGVDFAVKIDRLYYANFAFFMANTFSELKGWAEADLKVGGSTQALQVRGRLALHETSFTPAMTEVRYTLSETPLEFTAEGLSLDGLTLRDPNGKELKINGKLETADWKDIRTSLRFEAEDFQVLNTEKQDNQPFYGHLFVSTSGRVRGPLSALNVSTSIRTSRRSDFTYIYDAASQSAQHEGIVVFIQPERQYVRPPIYDQTPEMAGQGLTLSAAIEIDSNLALHTVVNPVTGDEFQGAAEGRLQLDLMPNGNTTLAGRVELVHGFYNFSYQSVVKRRFDVARGSTITWSGDVGNPELALIAQYRFQTSPYPLVANQLASATPEETARYRPKQVFLLQSDVRGTPREPNVNFKFVYVTNSQSEGLASSFSGQQTGLVESAIGSINTDPNLLSRQVFGVLLMKSFIGESAGTATNVSGNPLRAGLSAFLTSQVNALAQQYLTFIDLSVEAKDDPNNNGAAQSEGTTQYELRLQKSFFDDRLTFKLSSGTSVSAEGDEIHNALENASVEYAVTRDGWLRVTVFSEQGFELLNASAANLRNSGAGVLVSKEFNHLRKKRVSKKEENQ